MRAALGSVNIPVCNYGVGVMFKVGKRYEFKMMADDGEIGTSWGEVELYEHPLLKLKDVDLTNNPFHRAASRPPGKKGPQNAVIPGKIINVTSPSFVSAVEQIPDDE